VIQPLLGRVFYEDCRNFQSRTACGKEKKEPRSAALFLFKIDAGGRRQLCQGSENQILMGFLVYR